MADASDIAEVRRNVNEPTDTGGYTSAIIGDLIDALGVAGASAKIWEEKAAKFSELVNVTEAGASHSFSDLYKNAQAMATYWSDIDFGSVPPDRVKVKKIVRS